MNDRLLSDHARALARALAEVVRPCLREEELGECFQVFLALCRDGMADYGRARLLMEKRLRPLATGEGE